MVPHERKYRILPLPDQQEILEKTGFSVTDTRLEYYGYCGDCQGKAKEERRQNTIHGNAVS